MQLQDITAQFVGNGTNGNYGLMNRRDLYNNSTLTTTFLNNAIQRIQRELRCPMNEKWVKTTFGDVTVTFNGEVFYAQTKSYVASTGVVTLTLANAADGTSPAGFFAVGNSVTVAGFAGTGSITSLNGAFNLTSASGNTVTYTAPASLTLTIAAYNTNLVIPNDYLELIGIVPTADWYRRTKPDKLERVLNYAQFASGAPVYHARQGGVWVLGPAPTAGQVVTLGYYSEFTPLTNPTDQNILSIVAWDVILYGALSEACAYYNDKRRGSTVGPDGKIIDGFEGKYNQILNSLNEMGADDELDEGRVQPAYYYPEDDTDNLEIWVP